MKRIDAQGIPKDSKCGKASSIKIRRAWSINPKTRVKESKKKDINKLSHKDVRRILQEEDF